MTNRFIFFSLTVDGTGARLVYGPSVQGRNSSAVAEEDQARGRAASGAHCVLLLGAGHGTHATKLHGGPIPLFLRCMGATTCGHVHEQFASHVQEWQVRHIAAFRCLFPHMHFIQHFTNFKWSFVSYRSLIKRERPPRLVDPQKVISHTQSEQFGRSFQPNVALAPPTKHNGNANSTNLLGHHHNHHHQNTNSVNINNNNNNNSSNNNNNTAKPTVSSYTSLCLSCRQHIVHACPLKVFLILTTSQFYLLI